MGSCKHHNQSRWLECCIPILFYSVNKGHLGRRNITFSNCDKLSPSTPFPLEASFKPITGLYTTLFVIQEWLLFCNSEPWSIQKEGHHWEKKAISQETLKAFEKASFSSFCVEKQMFVSFVVCGRTNLGIQLASLRATTSLKLIAKCIYKGKIRLGTHSTKLSSIQINDRNKFGFFVLFFF